MKIFEKIRHIRKDVLDLSLTDFHARLVAMFGENALTYASLNRLEKGHRDEIRNHTLRQICKGLGITLKELKEGTDEEDSKIVTIVKEADKKDNTYTYNEDAIGRILTPDEARFFVMELPIKPGGITREEQDPSDNNKHEKLLSVSQGKILVCVGKEKHLIRRGDSVYFPSNLPHHFENPSKKVAARCLIVQNPKVA